MSNGLFSKIATQATVSLCGPVDVLREIIHERGHDPDRIDAPNLEKLAVRLSEIASKEPAWGWRYMWNVLTGKIEPSKKLADAIYSLATIERSTQSVMQNARPVQVYVLNEVTPGSLVFGSSRVCANPACAVTFISDIWNKRCCSRDCSKAARKAKHATR